MENATPSTNTLKNSMKEEHGQFCGEKKKLILLTTFHNGKNDEGYGRLNKAL